MRKGQTKVTIKAHGHDEDAKMLIQCAEQNRLKQQKDVMRQRQSLRLIYLSLTNQLSKGPTVDHTGINGKHENTGGIEKAIVRDGSQEVSRL